MVSKDRNSEKLDIRDLVIDKRVATVRSIYSAKAGWFAGRSASDFEDRSAPAHTRPVAAGALRLCILIAGLGVGHGWVNWCDEARIGLVFCPFGLGHDPAPAAPALARRPHEALEAALRPAGASALGGDGSSSVAISRRAARSRQSEQEVTPLASHQAIRSSRAKPLSARNRMRTRGHRRRTCATMRAISSTAPAAASRSARRSLATSRWRPQNT